MKKLQPNHERFLQAMLQYNSQTQAYLAVYPKSSPAAAKANASRLMKQYPEIRRRLDEHHEQLMEQADKERLARMQNAFKEFCAGQEIYEEIIAGGPVSRLLPNGEVIPVPSTIEDRLRAISRSQKLEKEFLAKYPAYFKVLYPDAAVDGGNKGYQNEKVSEV